MNIKQTFFLLQSNLVNSKLKGPGKKFELSKLVIFSIAMYLL